MTLVLGLLILSGVQASDVADGSKNHGVSSNYVPLRSGYLKSSLGVNGKFMAHHLKHMEHGGRPKALRHADDFSVRLSSSHADGKFEGIVDSPFMTYSDKPFHPTSRAQDTMDFSYSRAEALRISKDLEPQKIANKEQDKDV